MPRAGFKQSSGLFPSSFLSPTKASQKSVIRSSKVRAVRRLSSCDSARKVRPHLLGFHERGAGSFCGGLVGSREICRFDMRGGSTRCRPGKPSSVRTPCRRSGTTPATTRSNSSRAGRTCRLATLCIVPKLICHFMSTRTAFRGQPVWHVTFPLFCASHVLVAAKGFPLGRGCISVCRLAGRTGLVATRNLQEGCFSV